MKKRLASAIIPLIICIISAFMLLKFGIANKTDYLYLVIAVLSFAEAIRRVIRKEPHTEE